MAEKLDGKWHGRGANNARRTMCVRGHEFNKQNTRVAADGGRDCRMCDNIRKKLLQRGKRLRRVSYSQTKVAKAARVKRKLSLSHKSSLLCAAERRAAARIGNF